MTNLPTSLQSIATPPPRFPAAVVNRIVSEQYGLRGELEQLVSERDQNFRLTTADDCKFVVKIANSSEPALITDFQIQALLHLQERACKVAVPRIIRTQSGAVLTSVSSGNSEHSFAHKFAVARGICRQNQCRMRQKLS
jgi:Ser/Thr protein kinase RdoA (MazF antagonist)